MRVGGFGAPFDGKLEAYGGSNAVEHTWTRLGRLEAIMLCAAGGLLVGMAGLIITLSLRSP